MALLVLPFFSGEGENVPSATASTESSYGDRRRFQLSLPSPEKEREHQQGHQPDGRCDQQNRSFQAPVESKDSSA